MRTCRSGKPKASGCIPIKPVNGPDFGLVPYALQFGLYARRIFVGQTPRRLVHHQRLRRFCKEGKGAPFLRWRRTLNFHFVARPEPVVRHPDATAVDEDASLVQQPLGCPPGESALVRKKGQQIQSFRFPVKQPDSARTR